MPPPTVAPDETMEKVEEGVATDKRGWHAEEAGPGDDEDVTEDVLLEQDETEEEAKAMSAGRTSRRGRMGRAAASAAEAADLT